MPLHGIVSLDIEDALRNAKALRGELAELKKDSLGLKVGSPESAREAKAAIQSVSKAELDAGRLAEINSRTRINEVKALALEQRNAAAQTRAEISKTTTARNDEARAAKQAWGEVARLEKQSLAESAQVAKQRGELGKQAANERAKAEKAAWDGIAGLEKRGLAESEQISARRGALDTKTAKERVIADKAAWAEINAAGRHGEREFEELQKQRTRASKRESAERQADEKRASDHAISEARRVAREAKAARAELGNRASMAATLGGGAVLAGAGFGLSQFVEFDRGLRNTNTIAQLTEENLQKLGDSVLRLTDNPNIKQGPKDLNNALYGIYSSGKTGQEGLEILKIAALGASAGMTTTDTAAKVLLATLNSGIGGVNNSREAMNVLFKIVDRGVLTFEQLAGSIGQVLPIAQAAGIPIQELGAAYAVMTKNGLSADIASTDLLNLITKLVRPPKEAKGAFDELGISYGISALKAKGLGGVMQEIQEKTHGNKDALAKLFPDMQAFNGALILLKENGGSYRTELGQMNKAQEGQGALMRASAKQNQGASDSVDKLRKDMEKLAIEAGRALAPAMQEVIKDARELMKWFNSLDRATQDNYVKFGVLAGGALLLGGRLKDVVLVVQTLKIAHNTSAIAAATHATAEEAAALRTSAAWKRAYATMAARLAVPITIGVLLGGAGYDLARKNGWFGMNETDNPDAMSAAGNVAKRLGNTALNFGQYDSSSGLPIWQANEIGDDASRQAQNIFAQMRRRTAQEKADKASAAWEANAWGKGVPEWRKERDAADAPNPLGGYGTKPKKTEGERAQEKAEREAASAARRLEKDQLGDLAKSYDLLADATEKSARRQIDALRGISDSLKDVLGGLQQDLQQAGVTGNPLGGKINALAGFLNLGGQANGIQSHYDGVAGKQRGAANDARGALDLLQGGDGRNPGGSGAGRPAYIEGILRQTGKETAIQCGQAVSNAFKESGIRFTATQGARGGGQTAKPVNGRYPEGAVFAQDYGKDSQHFFVGYTDEKGNYVKAESTTAGPGSRRFRGDRPVTAQDIARATRIFLPPGTNAVYGAPGGGATQATATRGARSGNGLLDSLEGFGGLSGLNDLPRGWGGEMTANDTNAARMAFQKLLQGPKGAALLQAVQGKISPAPGAAGPSGIAGTWIRNFGNDLDVAANHAKDFIVTAKQAQEAATAATKTTKDLARESKEHIENLKIEHPEINKGLASGLPLLNTPKERAEVNKLRQSIFKDLQPMRDTAEKLRAGGRIKEADTQLAKAEDEFEKRFWDARNELRAAAAAVLGKELLAQEKAFKELTKNLSFGDVPSIDVNGLQGIGDDIMQRRARQAGAAAETGQVNDSNNREALAGLMEQESAFTGSLGSAWLQNQSDRAQPYADKASELLASLQSQRESLEISTQLDELARQEARWAKEDARRKADSIPLLQAELDTRKEIRATMLDIAAANPETIPDFGAIKLQKDADQTRAVYEQMFGAIAQGAANMENGIGGAVKGILGNLKNMAAQAAENWIFQQLLGLVGGGSKGATPDGWHAPMAIPSFAVGSNYVPRDMLANIHRGEMIIPAAQANALRGGAGSPGGSTTNHVSYTININGGANPQQTARAVGNRLSQHERDRRMAESARRGSGF